MDHARTTMPSRCSAASSTGAAGCAARIGVEVDLRARRQAPARDGGRELLHPLLRDGVVAEVERLHAGQAALVQQGDEGRDE